MYRNKSKRLSALRRFGIAALSGVMVLSLGFAAACSDDDEDSETTTTSTDTQTIANGNFEYFDTGDDDAHIIYDADSWSAGVSGNSNYSMSGIIDTSEEGWDTISNPELAYTLAANNVLDEEEDEDEYDELYVDYNDMKAIDIPYSNAYNTLAEDSGYFTIFEDDGGYYIYTNEYEAVIEQDEDELEDLTKQYVTENGDGTYYYTDSDEETITVYPKTLIDNPLTWNYLYDITDNGDGTATGYYDEKHTKSATLYIDDDDNYYWDEDLTEEYGTHVLMIHNIVNNSNTNSTYGNEQYYTSSTTITLDPNTAAVFSVWVKTTELTYGKDGTPAAEMDGDGVGNLGAYISVDQTVGGTSVGSFSIEGINTAGLEDNGYNGWVQYTVYLRACDFSSTTFTITLGLGDADDDYYGGAVSGYAFFDDLECTIYPTINDCFTETNSDLSNASEVEAYISTLETSSEYCSLDNLVDSDVVRNTYIWASKKDDTDPWYNYNTFYVNLADYTINSLTTSGDNVYTVTLGDSSSSIKVTVELTQDDDYYVTSTATDGKYIGVYVETDNETKQNTNLDLDTSEDVIIAGKISDILSSNDLGDYSDQIKSLFEDDDFDFTEDIPDSDSNTTTALVIVSAKGAAYTATIKDTGNPTNGEDNAFYVEQQSYKIVSFWVKTSDLDGFTAATINIVYTDPDTNEVISTLTVDTTDVTYDAGDSEDIYNGWVQCFFYVENTTDEDLTFYLEFCFGNTTIKDTTKSDYKSGYIAIANIRTFDVGKTVFELTSTGDYAASFSFEVDDERNVMDEVYSASSTDIETNIATPANYDGVYGGSARTTESDSVDEEGYDSSNNSGAGLINQDYFKAYIQELENEIGELGNGATEVETSSSYYWLQQLIKNYTSYSISDALNYASDIWNSIFGSACVQPLLIVNTIQYFESSGVYAMNYGFKASDATTVSSSSYEAITVRVYVSEGAVAYVYLTEEDDVTSVSSFSLPTYSFWYDTVGNVLDGEPDYDDEDYDATKHVVYYMRSDGLYEDKEGTTLYANLWNYSRHYYDENADYYEAGATSPTAYEDVDDDTVYYISAEEAAKALTGDKAAIQTSHYLGYWDSDDDDASFVRIFEYGDCNSTGEYGYYYIVTETDDYDETTVSYTGVVQNFDEKYARYDNSSNSQDLYVCIDARYDVHGCLFGCTDTNGDKLGYDIDHNYVGNQWTTVTFYVQTGDEDKSYVLELWSGSRYSSGVTSVEVDADSNITGSVTESLENSFVAFDYSTYTTDEDTYAEQLAEYENKVIESYQKLLAGAYLNKLIDEWPIKSSDQNIAYYEDLYTTYESAINTLLNQYSNEIYEACVKIINSYTALYYTYSLYDDANYVPFNADTAEDGLVGYDYNIDDYEETLVYFYYIEYAESTSSTTENAVSVFLDYSAVDVTVDSDVEDDDEDEDDDDESELTVWLLITSIILAVVLIFTLISILVRDLWKKSRRKRKVGKNVYSSKRKHYIRKLKLTEDPADGLDDEFSDGEFAESTEEGGIAENASDETAEDAETSKTAEPAEGEEPEGTSSAEDDNDDGDGEENK